MMTSINGHPHRINAGPTLVGTSARWLAAVRLAERYAPTKLAVLLVGATGTGKELLAQHIHRVSRRPGELVDVNCGALPREMIESLLFGHRRGAFTGASDESVGLIVRAGGGTLFLDELSSLPLEGQAKLLRVLETGEIRRLGDTAKQRVDFRIIAAVQENLPALLESGQLRQDLYHRVGAVVIRLPTLRERPDDITALVTHFGAANGRVVTEGALALLRLQPWPGNVRELRATVDRAAVLCEGDCIDGHHVVEALELLLPNPEAQADQPRHSSAQTPERVALLRLCEQFGWDREAIARAAGISRATLYRRLKACGIRINRVSASQIVSRSP